jgi:hypothetical protein
MPPRRVRERRNRLGPGSRLYARWELERDVVRFAVLLLVLDRGGWQVVELFDCSHDGRNDHHRYDRDGTKRSARSFHFGTPGEAMRDAIDLIETDYERMIERWRR